MDKQELAQYCLSLRGAVEDYPFGPEPLVIKVCGKMFALLADKDGVPAISLKCEPNMAELLRMQHECVQPGYHLNKKHWNTIAIDGTMPVEELRTLIDHSYELVVGSLTKAQRTELQEV